MGFYSRNLRGLLGRSDLLFNRDDMRTTMTSLLLSGEYELRHLWAGGYYPGICDCCQKKGTGNFRNLYHISDRSKDKHICYNCEDDHWSEMARKKMENEYPDFIENT